MQAAQLEMDGIGDRMEEAVDIGHRLSPRKKDGSCRSIIILFGFHRNQDTVWQAARDSTFLWDREEA